MAIDDATRERARAFVAKAAKDAGGAGPAPEYKSFKEAFAANRKAGEKTFEYKGKTYTTDLAPARKEAPKPKPKPAPTADSESEGSAPAKVKTLAPADEGESPRVLSADALKPPAEFSGMGVTKRAEATLRGKAY